MKVNKSQREWCPHKMRWKFTSGQRILYVSNWIANVKANDLKDNVCSTTNNSSKKSHEIHKVNQRESEKVKLNRKAAEAFRLFSKCIQDEH